MVGVGRRGQVIIGHHRSGRLDGVNDERKSEGNLHVLKSKNLVLRHQGGNQGKGHLNFREYHQG